MPEAVVINMKSAVETLILMMIILVSTMVSAFVPSANRGGTTSKLNVIQIDMPKDMAGRVPVSDKGTSTPWSYQLRATSPSRS